MAFHTLLVLLLGCTCVAAEPTTRPDQVIADFEGATYGDWTKTGDAFGDAPAQGALATQMSVDGFQGHGLVNTYFHGDGSQGTLTSPKFEIAYRYVNFLIGGGNHPNETCINLLIDGKVVRTTTGRDDEHLDWATWDVTDLVCKTARIEIVDRNTGNWGHINVDQIVQGDVRQEPLIVTSPAYAETCRPQFHFTSRTGWLNDPNGLVFYKGEYHLFFQHNPKGTVWGNMTWGHAVSDDLLHWTQLPNAIEPDKLGTIFSGSAVVDWNDTSGFQSGNEKPIVAMYTAAGQPFTQCIAYSNDRGRTFTKYAKNPVLGNIKGSNRDPKLVWHEPSKKWILALFIDGNTYALFSSPNLKDWTHLQDLPMPDCGECPDFFPIQVAGEKQTTKWVFTAANGQYFVGDFDGSTYTPETRDPQRVEFGRNDYAVQTYSDLQDGRRIQIAWMNGGKYPQMPFNQQMSIPCELTLHREQGELRLWKAPIREVEKLRDTAIDVVTTTKAIGDNAHLQTMDLPGDMLDIVAEFEVAHEGGIVTVQLFGQTLQLDATNKRVSGLGDGPLPLDGSTLRLRLLVDRTSMEAFVNDGRATFSTCYVFLRKPEPMQVTLAHGIEIKSIKVYPLHSVWPQPSTHPAEKH